MMYDVTSVLGEILAAHDVETAVAADGWLRTRGGYPACRAYTSEPESVKGGYCLRLDIEVALSAGRVLLESFGDVGQDAKAAFQSSMQNFCRGSLHVLLSGVWGVSDPDQVFVEEFSSDRQQWRLHIGNLVGKAYETTEVPPPDDLLHRMKQLLQQNKLSQATHWGRVYYANMPVKKHTVEVLLDNEPWAEGESAIRNAAWHKPPFFYSLRMFWIMVPIGEAA